MIQVNPQEGGVDLKVEEHLKADQVNVSKERRNQLMRILKLNISVIIFLGMN